MGNYAVIYNSVWKDELRDRIYISVSYCDSFAAESPQDAWDRYRSGEGIGSGDVICPDNGALEIVNGYAAYEDADVIGIFGVRVLEVPDGFDVMKELNTLADADALIAQNYGWPVLSSWSPPDVVKETT